VTRAAGRRRPNRPSGARADLRKQLLARLDRVIAELEAFRAELAGDRPTGELSAEEERELAELAERRAVRLRRSRP